MKRRGTTKSRIRSALGQGLSEYTSALAFVGLLIAMVFGVGPGTLNNAFAAAIGFVVQQINAIN